MTTTTSEPTTCKPGCECDPCQKSERERDFMKSMMVFRRGKRVLDFQRERKPHLTRLAIAFGKDQARHGKGTSEGGRFAPEGGAKGDSAEGGGEGGESKSEGGEKKQSHPLGTPSSLRGGMRDPTGGPEGGYPEADDGDDDDGEGGGTVDVESPVSEMGVEVPSWIEGDISGDTVLAIEQGGSHSGAYMPAVTYHEAQQTMAEHGDDVLQYIEDVGMEVPALEPGDSWSGYAVKVLATAVDLWAMGAAEEVREATGTDEY